jgi:hypothetical protein
MARYRILIADPLLQVGPQWPEGCALAGQLEPGPAGTHWHLFDDPDAPEGLEGKDVALTMRRAEDGSPEIAGRHVILTHQVPPEGGVMPCCGLTPFEVPHGDRITEDASAVTCGRTP